MGFEFDEKAWSYRLMEILRKYEPTEIIEKFNVYEQKQIDNIEVGDEVVRSADKNAMIIVSHIYTTNGNLYWCDGICKDGKVYHILTKNARKTGRHFDIQKILEEMEA